MITPTEEKRTALKGMVQEAVESKYRQDAEKELQKEIAQRAKEEFTMSKREFNSIVKVAYRDNGRQVERETTELLDLAEELGFYVPEEKS